MSFTIIVKSNPLRFKPHFNRELGNQYIASSKEYVHEMKKRGLEPYRPEDVKKPERKPYKPSEWAHGIASYVQRNGVTGSILREIDKKLKHKPRKLTLDGKGGFNAADQKRS